MPFMRGSMPLRRTLHHLKQGKMILRDNVAVFMLNYHVRPTPEQKGAAEFKYWHWNQLQYKNTHIQLVKLTDYCITPFALTILRDGREVLFDLESRNKDEIVDMIQDTLGKTPLVMRREALEKIQDHNPADFGSDCKRHCMCEVQGQHACTSLLIAPDYMTAKWRWNHNLPQK